MSPNHTPRCTGLCHQGRRACACSTGQRIPAEACTELGADTAPAPLSLLRRLRIALLQWQASCIQAERDHYRALGMVGPIYLRESYAQQYRLLRRITALQQPTPAGPQPAWLRTLSTALVAVVSMASLVVTGAGK